MSEIAIETLDMPTRLVIVTAVDSLHGQVVIVDFVYAIGRA